MLGNHKDKLSVLADRCGPSVRIMRALTALGIFKETGERTYAATPLSLLVVGDDIRDEMQIAFVVDSSVPD